MCMENYKENEEAEILKGYSTDTVTEGERRVFDNSKKEYARNEINGKDDRWLTNGIKGEEDEEECQCEDKCFFVQNKKERLEVHENESQTFHIKQMDNFENKKVDETEISKLRDKTVPIQINSGDKNTGMRGEKGACHEESNETYDRLKHMKTCVVEIKKFMDDSKDEVGGDCPCKIDVPLKSLTDVFKHYGVLCHCMVYHKKSMTFDFGVYIKVFLLEISLLEYLYEKPITIPEVFFGSQNRNEEKDQYVASYKTFFNETRIHINCEQDIESLSYKYYKHYAKSTKNLGYYVDPLLFLLYKRRESERYFLVFGNYSKTLVGLRIALLLSLFSECCKEVDEVKKIHARNKVAKDEGILSDIRCDITSINGEQCNNVTEDSLDDIMSYNSNSSKTIGSDCSYIKKLLHDDSPFSQFEKVFSEQICTEDEITRSKISKRLEIDKDSALLFARIAFYIYNSIDLKKDCSVWFREREIKKTWEESVKKWAFSKNKDNGNVDMDNAMILQCSKYRRFEEGYLIFTMQAKKNERCLLKTCFLCLHAYKSTSQKIWIERICDLLKSAAVGKMKSACCAMADNILEGAIEFEEDGREMLLSNVISIVDKFHLEKQEDLIDVILRGFFALCTHCKDSKTCDMCYNYTLRLYNKWKESKQGFFFKKCSKLSDDIYSSTLGVCDQSNHCDAFHKICRDILKSNENVGNNVMCRLESYHKKCNCQEISYATHQNDKSYCEVLLKHCICEYKK